MESTGNYILSRDDIRLFLRPTATHDRWQRLFNTRLSAVGLIGAALIYASALVPALISYQSSNRGYQPRLPVLVQDNALAAEPKIEPTTPENSADLGFGYQNLGIFAPVTWDVTYNEATIQENLQNGLAHLKGTARPGEKGTVILTGHSSNFAWAKGDYKTVFAPLLKANLDDELKLKYQDQEFTYKISQIYEVAPTRVDLLTADGGASLRLITCTPLGSTRKRLIVDAVQVSPAEADNVDFDGTPIEAGTIIGAR